MQKLLYKQRMLFVIFLASIIGSVLLGGCSTIPTSQEQEKTGKLETHSQTGTETQGEQAKQNLTKEEQDQIATELINQIDAMVQEELSKDAGVSTGE